ncbi:MAG: hypothetical protein CMG00_09445, partial [Candidatus Marinimicrobia bacterium]|nr:hypothetical protein [Candidatus Neomarinimicrobiota bacterium]
MKLKKIIGFIISAVFFGQDYSLQFDGVDDYVDLGRPSSLNFTPRIDDFTIMAWIKVDSKGTIYSYGASDIIGNTQIKLVVRQDNNFLEVNIGGEVSYGSTALNDGKWHNVCVTVPASNSGIKMYIDGEIEEFSGGVGSIGNAQSQENGNIGSRTNGSGYFYNGLIDRLGIWDIVLSENQIQDILNNSSIFNQNIIAYYTFNYTEEYNVYDQSGNGNHGTINGATWVENIYGCTDELACNHNPDANISDDSCDYSCHDNGDY